MRHRLYLVALTTGIRTTSAMVAMDDLFVNRTHFGYGDQHVYSTTSPFAYVLYASGLISILVIAWSVWMLCASSSRPRRAMEDPSKEEGLLEKNPYAKIDALLEQFHREVQQSEVLVYDDVEQDDRYGDSGVLDTSDDNDDAENDTTRTSELSSSKRQGPPVVDGFYSLTHDDPTLDYNEDMYLEFVPTNRSDGNGCSIHGYGKYDTGNVRVVGLVASTGEAYWYEVPYDAENANAPPVVLARGTFSRHERSGGICFVGQWYRSNGEQGGTYRLYSHKVTFPSSNCPSVAESMTIMECSFSGSVLGDSIEGSLNASVLGDIENGIDILHESDPPTVVVLDDDSSQEASVTNEGPAYLKDAESFADSRSSGGDSSTLEAYSLV